MGRWGWVVFLLPSGVFAQVVERFQDMDYGKFSVGPTGGSVVLTPTPQGGCSPSATGSVSFVDISSVQCARFVVRGVGNRRYIAWVTPPNVVISNGTQSMTVQTFVLCSYHSTNCQNSVIFSRLQGGQDTLTIGATLQAQAGQAEGIYTGNFTVRVFLFPW